jgi:hypothetical protein
MPQALSLARALVAEDFILANGTLILVKPLAPGVSVPTLLTLTVDAGGVAVGGTSVPLTAPLPDKLYAGNTLKFGTTDVIITADVAAGLSAIPIEAATVAIAAAATAETFAMIPLYSSNDATTTGGEAITKSRNFLSGTWESSRITMLNWEIPVSGDFIINDPGAIAIKQQWKSRSKLYIEIYNPGGQGGDKGTGFISKYSFTRKEDQNCGLSFTIVGDGPLDDLPIIV